MAFDELQFFLVRIRVRGGRVRVSRVRVRVRVSSITQNRTTCTR